MIQLADEFTHLEAAHEALEAALALPDRLLFQVIDAVSGWSIGQHIHHTALSTISMLKAAVVLTKPGNPYAQADLDEEGPNRIGEIVLKRGTIARGRGEAPDRVRPPDLPSRSDLEEILEAAAARIRVARATIPAAGPYFGRLPHPYFGALNTPEWVRVARVHAAHHLAIIADLEAALQADG